MKLLCISRKHPPSVGGMQTMNYEVIRRLSAATGATVIAWGYSQIFLPLFLLCSLLRSLVLLPKSRRPDAIYLGDALLSPLGLLLKIILRRPVAVTAHGRDLTFRFPLYRSMIGYSLSRLDRVIGVSKYTTDLCLAMGVPSGKCITINNGVNPEEHIPSADDIESAEKWLTSRGIESDRPIIITEGRLVKRKGVARFVRNVMPLLVRTSPRILYIVIGEGKEKNPIESEIRLSGMEGNAILAGRLPRELICGLMGIAKIFVMPNIHIPGDAEGFGLVALEASCAGLPVVASDLEGIRDAAADGDSGFLIPHNDHQRFAATIAMLLGDEKKRRAMGKQGRNLAHSRCRWDCVAEKYLKEIQVMAEAEHN